MSTSIHKISDEMLVNSNTAMQSFLFEYLGLFINIYLF